MIRSEVSMESILNYRSTFLDPNFCGVEDQKLLTPFPDCLYNVPGRRYWPLPLSCTVVQNRSTVSGPPSYFWGEIPKISLRNVLLITDTRHLLKCRKAPFRSKKVFKTKSSKLGSYGAPTFFGGGGAIPKKSLRSVLLPTDTRHVLKFCKDPFRGVDAIVWNK